MGGTVEGFILSENAPACLRIVQFHGKVRIWVAGDVVRPTK